MKVIFQEAYLDYFSYDGLNTAIKECSLKQHIRWKLTSLLHLLLHK